MKAVVFHDVGEIRLEDVAEPKMHDPTDAIVKLTASAICGTDLHFVRGSFSGMKSGTILGHEGVGIVEEVGASVRNFRPGDRVVIGSTIACGTCSYCRAGYLAQYSNANPHGKRAGTAFFGGPGPTGPWHGLQAEMARIPYAHAWIRSNPHQNRVNGERDPGLRGVRRPPPRVAESRTEAGSRVARDSTELEA